MAVTRAITLRLEEGDFEHLEAEADRLGMRPGTLARLYLRAGLRGQVEESAEAPGRRVSLAASERLARLREELRHGGYADGVDDCDGGKLGT